MMDINSAVVIGAIIIAVAMLVFRFAPRRATASAGANTTSNVSHRPNDKPATQIGTVFSSAGFGGDLPDLGGITRESIGEESLTGMQFTPDGGYVIRRKKTRTCMPSDDVINTRPIFLVGGGGVQTFKASDVVVDRGTRRESSDDDKEGHTAATPDKSVRGTGRPADQPDRRPDPDRGRPAKEDPPIKKEPDTTSASTKVPPVSTADIAISGLPREATSQDIRALVEGTNSVVKGVRMAKGGEATVTIEGNEGFTRSVARKISGQMVKGAEITARLASDTAPTKSVVGKVAGAIGGVAGRVVGRKPAADSDETAEAAKSALPEGRTLRIGNLPYEVTVSDLETMFGEKGHKPARVIMPLQDSGLNRGYAWATFENAETATAAVDALKGTKWVDTELEIGLRSPKFKLPAAKPATGTADGGKPPEADPRDAYNIAGVPPKDAAATAPKPKTSKKGKKK